MNDSVWKAGMSMATVVSRPVKKVFVISPIGANGTDTRRDADRFLNYIVKIALPAPEYKVERADEDDSAWAITEAMLRAILEADICVADITGRNPNVMYELALAHAADKKVIIMKMDNDSPPFDIKDMRAITYGMMPEEVASAVEQLRAKAGHEPGSKGLRDMLNPVATAFRNWMDVQRVESATGSEGQAFTHIVENLERKVDKALRSVGQREVVRDGLMDTAAVVRRQKAATALSEARGLFSELQTLRGSADLSEDAHEGLKELTEVGVSLIENLTENPEDPELKARVEMWNERIRLVLADVMPRYSRK